MWMAVRDANVLELNRRYRERWEKVEGFSAVNVQVTGYSSEYVDMVAFLINEKFKGGCTASPIFYDPVDEIYRCYVNIRFVIKGVDF
jgi:hypothetical protein